MLCLLLLLLLLLLSLSLSLSLSLCVVVRCIWNFSLQIDVSDRMMGTLQVFTGLISFLFVAGGDTPKLPYQTRLDVFMLFSFVLVGLIMFVHGLLYYFREQGFSGEAADRLEAIERNKRRAVLAKKRAQRNVRARGDTVTSIDLAAPAENSRLPVPVPELQAPTSTSTGSDGNGVTAMSTKRVGLLAASSLVLADADAPERAGGGGGGGGGSGVEMGLQPAQSIRPSPRGAFTDAAPGPALGAVFTPDTMKLVPLAMRERDHEIKVYPAGGGGGSGGGGGDSAGGGNAGTTAVRINSSSSISQRRASASANAAAGDATAAQAAAAPLGGGRGLEEGGAQSVSASASDEPDDSLDGWELRLHDWRKFSFTDWFAALACTRKWDAFLVPTLFISYSVGCAVILGRPASDGRTASV